jgi:hypothetical protein
VDAVLHALHKPQPKHGISCIRYYIINAFVSCVIMDWAPGPPAPEHSGSREHGRRVMHKKSASESFAFAAAELQGPVEDLLDLLDDGPGGMSLSPGAALLGLPRAISDGQELPYEMHPPPWPGGASPSAGHLADLLLQQGSGNLSDLSLSSLDGSMPSPMGNQHVRTPVSPLACHHVCSWHSAHILCQLRQIRHC